MGEESLQGRKGTFSGSQIIKQTQTVHKPFNTLPFPLFIKKKIVKLDATTQISN